MPNNNDSEKRRFQRLDTRVQVILTYPDKKDGTRMMRESVSRNLSRSGILITNSKAIDLGTFIIAKFTLPNEPEPIEIFAKVVRVEEVGKDRYDIGITFTSFTKEAMEQLKKFLLKELEKQ
jgi:Tfp pilus assembly protein PilZ